jgi:hypothetical protein
MRNSKFSESRIAGILKEPGAGVPVANRPNIMALGAMVSALPSNAHVNDPDVDAPRRTQASFRLPRRTGCLGGRLHPAHR